MILFKIKQKQCFKSKFDFVSASIRKLYDPLSFQELFFRSLILYSLIVFRYPAHTYIHKELSQESCLHHENIIYGRGTHKT